MNLRFYFHEGCVLRFGIGSRCAIFMLLLVGLFSVATGNEKVVSSSEKPIRLAFYEFGYLYSEGKGIDRDIVDELSRRTGRKFETFVAPRARIWADLESGNLDMSVSGIQNAQRDTFCWFAHYMRVKNYAIITVPPSQKVAGFSSFVKQRNLVFGVVRGFTHGGVQDSLLKQLRTNNMVEESPDIEILFKKLKDGRINGMYSQPLVFRKYLKDLDMNSRVTIQDWAPGETAVLGGLIISKKRFTEVEARKWQSLIAEMKKDGTLKKIYLKYLPEEDVTRMLDF